MSSVRPLPRHDHRPRLLTALAAALAFAAPASAGEIAFSPEQTVVTLPPGVFLEDAEAADVDGDGVLDLVVSTASTVQWARNPGNPDDLEALQPIDPAFGGPIALTDVDGDEDVDVILQRVNGGSTEIVWLENPTWAAQPILDPGAAAQDLQLFDPDEDGDQDVLVAIADGLVLLRNGLDEPVPGWATEILVTGITPTCAFPPAILVTVGPVDADGDPDIVASTGCFLNGPTRTAWYENGAAWAEHEIDVNVGDEPTTVHLARIDTGPLADVVVETEASDTFLYVAAVAGGPWVESTVPQVPPLQSPFPADLDGDGDGDLVYAGGSQRAAWFENRGDGVWEKTLIEGISTVGTGLFMADLDGDGKDDLVQTGGFFSGTISWYRNRSEPGFICIDPSRAQDKGSPVAGGSGGPGAPVLAGAQPVSSGGLLLSMPTVTANATAGDAHGDGLPVRPDPLARLRVARSLDGRVAARLSAPTTGERAWLAALVETPDGLLLRPLGALDAVGAVLETGRRLPPGTALVAVSRDADGLLASPAAILR